MCTRKPQMERGGGAAEQPIIKRGRGGEGRTIGTAEKLYYHQNKRVDTFKIFATILVILYGLNYLKRTLR